MKLRCTENSIRIRIRKSELAVLRDSGKLLESVQFPDGVKFTYNLLVSEADRFGARFQQGNIWIEIPQSAATAWLDTDAVSLEATVPLPIADHVLTLLIEKDFPCQDRPDEDKSDYFEDLAAAAPDAC